MRPLVVILACVTLTMCVTINSAKELKAVQDSHTRITPIWYLGSNKSYHYFKEFEGVPLSWILLGITDGIKFRRVRLKELEVPVEQQMNFVKLPETHDVYGASGLPCVVEEVAVGPTTRYRINVVGLNDVRLRY